MDQHRVLDQVGEWATADDNVRLVVLTGSIALGDHVDDLSDLDLELYVLDPAPLLDGREWYRRFGRVLVREELENPDWHPTRLVYYVDGKIDFMIAPVEVAKRGIAYARPYRVVLDKDGLADSLQLTSEPARPPSAAEFEVCINWFFAAALMMAKCIVRGEPWMAKVREWDANTQLLQMIEWDHKARYGWDYDTWHLGGHLREWMDSEIVNVVGTCWADFATHNMRTALPASVALFDRLSARTAAVLRVEQFDSAPVRREIDRLLGVRAE
jgi:aminoglycoside 6-adenylyltransferase